MIKNQIKKIVLLAFFIVQINVLSAQGFGQSSLMTDWKFNLGDVRLGENESLDDSDWENVQVPHDWSVKQFASPHLASCTGYLPGGIGWYRTKINIPANSNRYYLYFEGVYNKSEVYINGKWLGKQYDGYTSFMYDITSFVRPGDNNVVAVRVDHSKDADSRWYTGSGIFRKVHLIEANNTHIGLYGVFYTAEVVNESKAVITIETTIIKHVKNSATVKVNYELFDSKGTLVTTAEKKLSETDFSSTTVSQILNVKNPKLWGINSPYLYVLKTTVTEGGKIVDESKVNVGIRSLKFDPDKGFALNNEWMKVKGVCLHHDAGVLGSAIPKEVWREKVLRLREIGCNAIRMSHNPQSTDLYDICDELGMLVMDEAFDEWEFPKKKWLEGWNVGDKPGFQGAAEYFREHGWKTLETMVYRDRNHPSVFMWSIGNEVDYPNDPYTHPVLDTEGIGQFHIKGYQKNQPDAKRLGDIAKELAGIVRNIDKSRPVTAALAGPVMSNETEYPGALDVVGYNYTESRYKMDHEKYPKRILYGSENRHDMEAWKATRDNDYIFGQFLWTGTDYLGEAGKWPSRGFTSGLIDLALYIKPQGFFRQSLWSEKPMVYVGTSPKRQDSSFRQMYSGKSWNYKEGQLIRVVCFTNGDEVEILVNDKVKGERQKYNRETGINSWEIPFEPGVLKAVSYKNNVKVAEDVIQTSGSPAVIKCNSKTDNLKNKLDVALIEIKITDNDGNIAVMANNEIRCRISGPGKLLGLENASSDAAEDFNDNVHRCINGKLLAYIQATENSGEITVEFESPYLESARQIIKIGN